MGASLVAKDLVLVLLGAQWISAIPFVQWLAIHGAFWAIVQSMQPYFLISRRERLFTLCNVAYVAVLVPSIIIAAHAADVEAVAATRTTVTALFLVGMLGMLAVLQILSLRTLVSLLWRPVIAIAAMAICVWSIDLAASPIVMLSLSVAAGLIIFYNRARGSLGFRRLA